MLRSLCLSALLLALLAGALAQPDPNNLPMDNALMMPMVMLVSLDQMPVTTKSTPNGIFAFRHGVLVKYDAKTLQQQGMLELLGPLGPWDKNRLANKDDGMMMLLERTRHMMPSAMAVSGKDLYLTMGGQLYRIDGEKLRMVYSVQIIQPDPLLEIARSLDDGPAMGTKAMRLFMPCQLDVNGNLLQITHGNDIIFVNMDDGKITARSQVPEALSASLITMPNEGPFAAPPAPVGAVDGKTFTTLGIVTKHPEVNEGIWTVKTEDGAEYVLLNGPGSRKNGVPRMEGVRVLVRGTYSKEHPGLATYGKGFIEVNGFLLLTTAEVGKE